MGVTVRKATVEDASTVAPLFDAYRQFYEQPTDVNAAEKFIAARLQQNESVVFIAFDGEEAIGFTQLYPIFTSVGLKKTWLLNDLYVAANARGKGAATALLNAAKEHGIATNSKWLLLETANDNFIAQNVYEKNNWKKVEQYCFYTLQLNE